MGVMTLRAALIRLAHATPHHRVAILETLSGDTPRTARSINTVVDWIDGKAHFRNGISRVVVAPTGWIRDMPYIRGNLPVSEVLTKTWQAWREENGALEDPMADTRTRPPGLSLDMEMGPHQVRVALSDREWQALVGAGVR